MTPNIDYLILSLSSKKISLLSVIDSHVLEIKDENFPMIFSEESGSTTPSSGFSLKNIRNGFRKDKSIVDQVRFASFLRSADERLKCYLKKDHHLLITGAEEKLKNFENITHHQSRMAGQIVGSYTDSNRGDLIKKCNILMN